MTLEISPSPETRPEQFVQHDFAALAPAFRSASPFDHVVIDDFFDPPTARTLAAEVPAFDDPVWAGYRNAIEVKKVLNRWDRFGAATYRVLQHLNSPGFVGRLSALVGAPLHPDYGLNGGGLHTHAAGGKLNTHLDYALHPKLGLERRLNLIVYLSPDWDPAWGGSLGLWEHDADAGGPGRLAREIPCAFNRAVVFDTSQNSWHGLPDALTCPPGRCRNSLAAYYLCEPRPEAGTRGKALFTPTEAQRHDPAVLDLIARRSQVGGAAGAYGAPER